MDSEWHLPHFEKMLYDQGQLATSYLDAYQVCGTDDVVIIHTVHNSHSHELM